MMETMLVMAMTGRSFRLEMRPGETVTRRDGDAWRYEWAPELRALKRHNPLNEAEPAVDLPGLTGNTVGSTFTLAGTLHWVASAAEGMPTRRLWNASERGAAIPGWEARTLAAVVDDLPEIGYAIHGTDTTDPETLAQWVDGQIRAVGDVEVSAYGVATATHVWPDLDAMLRKLRHAPLLEPWCQASIVKVLDSRRLTPMRANPWEEMQESAEHARQLASVVIAEAPTLVDRLRTTKERLCELARLPAV